MVSDTSFFQCDSGFFLLLSLYRIFFALIFMNQIRLTFCCWFFFFFLYWISVSISCRLLKKLDSSYSLHLCWKIFNNWVCSLKVLELTREMIGTLLTVKWFFVCFWITFSYWFSFLVSVLVMDIFLPISFWFSFLFAW